MSLIKITPDDPEELFKPPEFPVLPAGDHLFLVANSLEITQSSGEIPKNMIMLEARCQDDDENKGMVVFDCFLLIDQATDDKSVTSKKIHDAKFAQFICACGVSNQEDLKAGKEFDFADCNGKFFNATTKVALEPVYPSEIGEDGKPIKAPKASIKRYLFEPKKEETAA